MAHQAEAGCVRVGAFDTADDRHPVRSWPEPLNNHTGPFDHALEDVGVAGLVARLGSTVVDALVANQRLQQCNGAGGQRVEFTIVHPVTLAEDNLVPGTVSSYPPRRCSVVEIRFTLTWPRAPTA